MRRLFLAAALVATLGVSSCGFSPLYATADSRFASLGAIKVEVGDGRLNYLFAESMNEKLGARADEPIYVLETVLSEQRQGFGIRVDDVATRYESTVTAAYRLRRISDGEVVIRGQRDGTASYDVPTDPYAELFAEERAKERAVTLSVEKIRLDLSLYFAHNVNAEE